LPLRKILNTLGRKGFLETVVWEKRVENPEYSEECRLSGKPDGKVDRLHFFSKKLTSIGDLKSAASDYGGYCDLRLKSRTVVGAYITNRSILRPGEDTYAFLCCTMSKDVLIQDRNGGELFHAKVLTYPFFQKNDDQLMCSQAALLTLTEYWNDQKPGMFSARTVSEINKKTGVAEAVFVQTPGRGLDFREIMDFLTEEKVHFVPMVYKKSTAHLTPLDIYGFVESGFPVLLDVKTQNDRHAVVCIGHTYDRNSWAAMTDVRYFGKLVAGGKRYLPNTGWINNFLINDDNLGPYFFANTIQLAEAAVNGLVVIPDSEVKTSPSEATEVAFSILNERVFDRSLLQEAKRKRIPNKNVFWLKHFLDRLSISDDEGILLRPLLASGEALVKFYKDHEIQSVLKEVFDSNDKKLYWYIELSWPEIHCHRQYCCGCVIIEPASNKPVLIHVPGYCVVWHGENLGDSWGKGVDAPRTLFKKERL
jgi:hypothetical protein